jgi:hypothetical protein
LPIADTADIDAAEILDEVFKAHPECAIIFLEIRLDDFDNLRVFPLIRFIAPSSVPFKLSPGVTDVKKAMTLGLCYFNDTVCMARDEATIGSLVVGASPSVLP